jgi:hypothetical protein
MSKHHEEHPEYSELGIFAEYEEKPKRKRRVMCEDCRKYPADLPSRICPGCDAYREHTGHF